MLYKYYSVSSPVGSCSLEPGFEGQVSTCRGVAMSARDKGQSRRAATVPNEQNKKDSLALGSIISCSLISLESSWLFQGPRIIRGLIRAKHCIVAE